MSEHPPKGSSDPRDAELDAMRSDAETEKKSMAERGVVVARFRSFLEEGGEVLTQASHTQEEFSKKIVERLSADGIDPSFDTEIDPQRGEEIAAELLTEILQERNRVELANIELEILAELVTMQKEATDEGTLNLEENDVLKKNTQARLLAKGYSRRWVHLVEQELLGEGLQPDEEIDFVSEAMYNRAKSDEETDELLTSTATEMRIFLVLRGEEITLEAHEMLDKLATIKVARTLAGASEYEGVEQIKTLLREAGFTSRAWIELADTIVRG